MSERALCRDYTRLALTTGKSLSGLLSVALAAAFILTGSVAAAAIQPTAGQSGSSIVYVNPTTGTTKGSGTAASPLKTIQVALDRAIPGTTIELAAGMYKGSLTTQTNGTASKPITIQGPPPQQGTATVFGNGHVFGIENSHYVLRGFSIDGEQAVENELPESGWPTDLNGATAFKDSVQPLVQDDRLIFIDAGATAPPVTGTVIDDMTLTGAGGECIRIRDNANNNVVTNSIIRWCGMFGKKRAGIFTFHNGEGVYIGTSPKSTTESNYSDDAAADNLVSDDTISTFGSECFDVKEHSHDNTMTGVTCEDNTEPTTDSGSNVELRGYDNLVSDSVISGSAGLGVKIAADSTADANGGNSIESNQLSNQAGSAFFDKPNTPDGEVCGNVMSGADASTTSAWLAPCPTPMPVPTGNPTTPSPPAPIASPPVERPTVTMLKHVAKTRQRHIRFRWSAPRGARAAETFQLRIRHGRSRHHLGSWRTPRSEHRTRATSHRLTATRGLTYCVEVRARSNTGRRSRWTRTECVSRIRPAPKRNRVDLAHRRSA
jgi:hypothetical protein